MPRVTRIYQKAPAIIGNLELYAPLRFQYEDALEVTTRQLNMNFDAIVRLYLQNESTAFLALLCPSSTPKIAQSEINLLNTYRNRINESNLLLLKANKLLDIKRGRINYLLVAPYLSKNVQDLIKDTASNAVDLCGNYWINTGNIVAIRLDQPNRYKDSKPIKKICSGNSSLVPRFMLRERKVYKSVNEIFNGILDLGGLLAISTVSKVLTGLADELMISKELNRIEVLQADKILDSLARGYEGPKIENIIKLRIAGGRNELLQCLKKNMTDPWVISGDTAANEYAATTLPQVYKIYGKKVGALKGKEDDRFYNIVLQETETPYLYFDRRKKNNIYWPNDVQTFLELSQGDKREKEIADTIKKNILRRFQ